MEKRTLRPTTVRLDQKLIEDAKVFAIRNKTTLQEMIAEGLRLVMKAKKEN
jgi:hypothetical protein